MESDIEKRVKELVEKYNVKELYIDYKGKTFKRLMKEWKEKENEK